jgi:cytidylate kinase
MIIVVGGTPGSGKTTVAELFAKDHGYVLVSAGMIFRQMAASHGETMLEFSRRAEGDHAIDRELDRRVLEEILRHDSFGSDVIVDGRIQGFLLAARRVPCLKVWIDARLDVRALRVARREGTSAEDARADILGREASERRRYRDIYGIDLADTKKHDLVVDSSEQSPEAIVELVRSRVDG